jgi:hypothetical protein
MERHEKAYARWLAVGARLGFAALVASFLVYLVQWIPAAIAPSELPRYWGLPVAEYLAATHAPTGWHWVALLPQSDVLNFVGVAILGAASVACYLRVLVGYAKERDWAYVAIIVLQVAVLLVAASGVLN